MKKLCVSIHPPSVKKAVKMRIMTRESKKKNTDVDVYVRVLHGREKKNKITKWYGNGTVCFYVEAAKNKCKK
jgi:hypothetical protein